VLATIYLGGAWLFGKNRILELEIGVGERNICVCVCADVCERRKKDLK
jgi:hypothetical protein